MAKWQLTSLDEDLHLYGVCGCSKMSVCRYGSSVDALQVLAVL